jgi:hypothetical protein
VRIAIPLVAALALTPPAAQAGFAPAPKQLSEPFTTIANTAEAVDLAGNTTAVWDQNIGNATATAQIGARRLAANGSLGTPLLLSTAAEGGYQPAVGVGSSGAAFAAWRVGVTTPTSVEGRWINADGSLGPVLSIVKGSASEEGIALEVVVDATGTATVAWSNQASGDRVELLRVHPDGSESAQVNTKLAALGRLRAAALPNGATFLVNVEAMTDVVAANGTPGPPVSASTSGSVSSLGPGVAFDSQGEGIVAWRHGFSEPWEVVARRINSLGVPIGSELVVEPETFAFVGANQYAAGDSSGHFLVGWSKQDAVNEGHAYVRTVNPDGSVPTAAHAVSGLAGPVPEPLLTLDDRGVGLAAFSFFGSGGGNPELVGQLLDLTTTPVAAPAPLSLGAPVAYASLAGEPAAGVSTVLWSAQSGAGQVATATRYMEPPTCTSSEATAVLGQPVSVRLACAGIGINGATLVSPPAHGTLGPFDVANRSVLFTPTPGYQGPDSFVFRMENDGGASGNAIVGIAIDRSPLALAPPAFSGPPVLSGVAQSHRRWREGRKLASLARRHRRLPVGTTFSFTLNEQAAVTLRFSRRVSGRKVGHRCLPASRKARPRKTCELSLNSGALSFTAHSGLNRVVFQGRLSSRRKLAPGSYSLLVTASDAAGARSAPKQLRFTIVS